MVETDIETLRFPIGKFKAPESVTEENIHDWINDIATLPARLLAATSTLGQSELDTRYREEGWTIR